MWLLCVDFFCDPGRKEMRTEGRTEERRKDSRKRRREHKEQGIPLNV